MLEEKEHYFVQDLTEVDSVYLILTQFRILSVIFRLHISQNINNSSGKVSTYIVVIVDLFLNDADEQD